MPLCNKLFLELEVCFCHSALTTPGGPSNFLLSFLRVFLCALTFNLMLRAPSTPSIRFMNSSCACALPPSDLGMWRLCLSNHAATLPYLSWAAILVPQGHTTSYTTPKQVTYTFDAKSDAVRPAWSCPDATKRHLYIFIQLQIDTFMC